MTIKGLLTSTTYHLRAHSTATTEAVSGDYTFSTQAAPDSAGPIVANIVSTPNINNGTDTNYGNIFGNNTLTTTHSVQLPSDLSQNTTYHYRIRTSDALGNLTVSADNTVQTSVNPVDTIEPVISEVSISSPSVTTITASWTTDENSTSYVAYSLDGTTFVEQGSATLTQNHSVTVVGLVPNTDYELQIKSSDAMGNVATDDNAGANYTQRTHNIDGESVVITWITDISADSQVEYGTDANYGTKIVLEEDNISHSVTVKSLIPGATYHFRVHSIAQTEGVSSDHFFTTLPPPDATAPIISGIVSSGISDVAATITWNTNKNTDSIVHFGKNENYTRIAGDKNASANTHSVSLGDLDPSTTYHYQIEARDEFGNVSLSADQTFTTLVDSVALSISNVEVLATTQTNAVISWDTNKDSSTRIIYGKDHDLTSSNETLLFGKNHYITISSLEKGTQYYYKVVSVDAVGNVEESAEESFISGVDPSLDHPPLETITFEDENPSVLTDTAAVISFSTDQIANCFVKYGVTSGSDNYTYTPVAEKANTFNKTHAIALTGMLFSTKHYYMVTCQDNLTTPSTVVSSEKDFTTLEKKYTQSEITGLDDLAPTITNVKVSNVNGENAV
ncbi:MAG: hypothetical protein US16_C0027G0007, partial [Candidatus Moranbacteria bacterium GW2011_GWE2_36_40]